MVAASVFSSVFPADCRLCSAPLGEISRIPVCQDCLALLTPMQGDFCSICGERLASFGAPARSDKPGEAAICGMCRRARPDFERAFAFGSYDGTLRELLHLLKYEGMRPVAEVLGTVLAHTIETGGLHSQRLTVVPVPLYRRRRGERGFNQAELLARAAVRKLPSSWPVITEALLRTRETASQTGLTRHQRRANVRGAFKVKERSKVAGKDILLVDDVLTTGTTAAECARVLKRAGAGGIYVATVARVLKGEGFQIQPQHAAMESAAVS